MKRTRKARDNGEDAIAFRIQNIREDYILVIKRKEVDDYREVLRTDQNIVTPIRLQDYN
jgi:hypothetical protein